jgi:Fe-S cluster assembly protein SufB
MSLPPASQADHALKRALDSYDDIPYSVYLRGLNEETIRGISADNNEPQWMLDHRLASFKTFQTMSLPTWGPSLEQLDLDSIVYYAKAEKDFTGYATDREKVPTEIKTKFERLGIPQAERTYLA